MLLEPSNSIVHGCLKYKHGTRVSQHVTLIVLELSSLSQKHNLHVHQALPRGNGNNGVRWIVHYGFQQNPIGVELGEYYPIQLARFTTKEMWVSIDGSFLFRGATHPLRPESSGGREYGK